MGLIEEAKKNLGELLIVGFQGLELSAATQKWFTEASIGGFILFSKNFESPAQLAELTGQIQSLSTELPFWISIDHEGGKVQRLKKHFTKIPDASVVASKNSAKLAFEIAQIMGQELKAVGVNLNFAPVLDIIPPQKNSFMNTRSFGSDPELVSRMGTAVMRGLLTEGIQPCVKHFPGHGDTTVDSHLTLPKIDLPLAELEKRELTPFIRAFRSKCPFLMTGHILNPQLDSEFPATLSKKILQNLLRQKLGYTGVIVSDDMEMKAITHHYGPEEAPCLALEAGCDLLIYSSESAGRVAHESLLKGLDQGRISAERVLDSSARVRALKKKTLLPYHPLDITQLGKIIGKPEHLAFITQHTEEKVR